MRTPSSRGSCRQVSSRIALAMDLVVVRGARQEHGTGLSWLGIQWAATARTRTPILPLPSTARIAALQSVKTTIRGLCRHRA